MSVSRTMREISKIPGVSTFRSSFQRLPPEEQVICLRPCNSCKEEFRFPHTTSWEDITRSIDKHMLLCDKKRAAASANAKKRWEKDRRRRPDADHQALQKADANIKQKKKEALERAPDPKLPGKTCRNLGERKAFLENDPWTVTESVEPKDVECVACHRKIRLDKRRLYYPGLWLKHKDKCTGINEVFTKADVMIRPSVEQCFMNRSRRRKRCYSETDEFTRLAMWDVAEACTADIEMHDVNCKAKCTQHYDPSDFDILDVPPTSSTSLNAILCPISTEEIEIRARHGLIRLDELCQESPESDGSQNSIRRGESISPESLTEYRPVAQKTSCEDGTDTLPFVMPQERDAAIQSSCISRNSPYQRRPRKSVAEKGSRRNERSKPESSHSSNSAASENGNGHTQPGRCTVDVAPQKIGARTTYTQVSPENTLVNISRLSRHASPAPLLLVPHIPIFSQQQKAPNISVAQITYVAQNPALGNCNYPIPRLRPVTPADFKRPDSCEGLGITTMSSREDATMDEV